MSLLKRVLNTFKGYGIIALRGIPAWARFWRSYYAFKRAAPLEKQPRFRDIYPFIFDATEETNVDPIYYYQDAWAFEKIVQLRPAWHVDVGSHHKYVALLSKVVPVTMVDIRPLPTRLESLTFRQGSILALPFEDNSVPSVSSICVVEHIGLGRYGDEIDPDGSEKALAELKRIVQPSGALLLSMPIDETDRVYFNGQRVFTEKTLLRLFEPFEMIERRYIYGTDFLERARTGFGVGCYYLRKTKS